MLSCRSQLCEIFSGSPFGSMVYVMSVPLDLVVLPQRKHTLSSDGLACL